MINWLNAHPLATLLIAGWTLAWKGVALWKSAERDQKYWFIAILILNTIGILDIIYIYFVARKYEVEVVEN